jgi:hypothetical protein
MNPKTRSVISQVFFAVVVCGVFIYYQNRREEERQKHLNEQMRELAKHPPQLPADLQPPDPMSIFKQTPPPATPAPGTTLLETGAAIPGTPAPGPSVPATPAR